MLLFSHDSGSSRKISGASSHLIAAENVRFSLDCALPVTYSRADALNVSLNILAYSRISNPEAACGTPGCYAARGHICKLYINFIYLHSVLGG